MKFSRWIHNPAGVAGTTEFIATVSIKLSEIQTLMSFIK